MISIACRPAKLGTNASVRTEKHGDANVQAVDVTATFSISEEELDAVLGEGSSAVLFVSSLTGPAEPRFKGIEGLALEEKLEDVQVLMRLGLKRTECSLGLCKLAKVVLSPATGGMTEVKLQIQATPTPDALAALTSHMNLEVELDLTPAPKAATDREEQPSLDLPKSDDPKLTHPEQLFKKRSGRTRRVAAH